MSIDELAWDVPAQVGRGGDRVPPQDLEAERSVLGGMMISKDAIADVVEQLRGTDFYRPAHEVIFDAILDLYGRGEPADAITVSDELTKRNELARVGGAPYLHTLIATVPTAANAGYYARIVRERAVLRKLVEAGTRIVQLGYGSEGGDVDELVNSAQAEVYAVTERRASEDYLPLAEILGRTVDEIETAGHRGEGMIGVPTGFADLDRLTNGLHPGQMIVLAARPAIGKALALDTPLPTPTGWTTMGAVRVGDELLAPDGTATRVVAATDVLGGRPCFRVTFDDGSSIVADAAHQWLTRTRAQRRAGAAPSVRTTAELADTVRCRSADRRTNHSVAVTRPYDPPTADLPVDPYALGVWLGNGASSSARFTSADPEIAVQVESRGLVARRCAGTAAEGAARRYALLSESESELESQSCTSRTGPDQGRAPAGERRPGEPHDHPGSVQGRLRTLGLLGNKHIPPVYLRASQQQRRDLLAGLLDARGTVTATGNVQITLAHERLARDTRELLHSLGYRTGWSAKNPAGRAVAGSTASAITITFTTDDEVFALERKRLVHKERRRPTPRQRMVVSVDPVESVPVRCVQVEHGEHLYLAGSSWVPTHNSTLGIDIARSAAIKHNLTSVVFSLEMSRTEITMRLLSAEARVHLQKMRTGQMGEDDWQKVAATMGRISEAPLFIDDSPNMSLMEIRAKCRRLKQRHDLKLVVIDYLQLMTSGKRVESRQQEVSEFSRALKLLAKELEVPVIAISQLNRGPEQRTDKKPQMSDLRESGCLTGDTRVLRADTGAETTLDELYALRATDVPVWALDERLQYVRRHLTHVFPTGTRATYRLRLASGKHVTATANHPFLTLDGWAPLGGLAVGDRLAVPRHVPGPDRVTTWSDARVALLARYLALGVCDEDGVRYLGVGPDGRTVADWADAALSDPGVVDGGTVRWQPTSPVARWLDDLGVLRPDDEGLVLPAAVHALPKAQIALFVRELWSTAGTVVVHANGRGGRLSFSCSSRLLLEGLSRLLLRFGISARLRTSPGSTLRPVRRLDIEGADDLRRFLQEIGVQGRQAEPAAALLGVVRGATRRRLRRAVQSQVWDGVRDVLRSTSNVAQADKAAVATLERPATGRVPTPRRAPLGAIAALLDDADLDVAAVNDLVFDEIEAIEPMGERPVYDATVLGTHNFVANGVAAHNSIEQDADMVILLHREDAYERESPRAGEADLIVAKHRNGPTDTITVAFQGHYSRFVDMQA